MSDNDPPVAGDGAAPPKSGRRHLRLAGGVRGRTNPFFRRIFERLAQPIARRVPGERGRARHLLSLCRALISELGEVSGPRLATEALAVYESLDPAAREMFFDMLVDG